MGFAVPGDLKPVVPNNETDHRYRLLYELGCAFAARIELDDLMPLVIARSRGVFDSEGASVLLLDAEANELYFPYVAEPDPDVAAQLHRLRFPADQGIAGDVLRHGRALKVDDVPSYPKFYSEVDRTTGFTTRAMLCAPLRARQGNIGVIQILNRRGGGSFDDGDLEYLEALAGSIAIAIENAQLYAKVKASEERLRGQVGALRRDLELRDRFSEIIGAAPAMGEVFRLMESAAASPIAVLIEGETGTGKELVARGIHKASARADGPFIAVNCAAVSETLLESELFGHRRGAFTGATQDQRGLFEAAQGGTIFLDEVGEMPASMQAKLLRVLQEGEVIPVGETRPRKIDVRVVSATNRDLGSEVANKAFRDDLYYRLAAFPIRMPPLRERREDIPLLVERILSAAAERHRKKVLGMNADALDLLLRFEWPGNVRELQNEIERAVALVQDQEAIQPLHLSRKLTSPEPASLTPRTVATAKAPRPGAGESVDLRQARAVFEAQFIAEVLRQEGGNVSHAAKALGLSRVMLQRKMKEYSLR